MAPDAAESELPPFVDFDGDDPTAFVARSTALHAQMLADFTAAGLPAPLVTLLGRVLPATMMAAWTYSPATRVFELRLGDAAVGVIRAVATGGVPMAKGARILLTERVHGEVGSAAVGFAKGAVQGSKAGVAVGVTRLAATATHFVTSQGKVRIEKALASVGDLEWS